MFTRSGHDFFFPSLGMKETDFQLGLETLEEFPSLFDDMCTGATEVLHLGVTCFPPQVGEV